MPPSPLNLPLFLLLTILTISSSIQQINSITTDQVRAGFWLSHSSSYSPLANINTSLFTHLYYSSLFVDETSLEIALPPPKQLPLLTSFSATLKTNNSALKTLLSISTATPSFSSIVSDAHHRGSFIDSVMALARHHSFDGLDLEWPLPSSSADMLGLGLLLTESRVQWNQTTTDGLDYPIDLIKNSVDWTNALCFNYHASDETVTSANAALYDVSSHFSTSYGITSWLDAGLPPQKLVMGVPLFGRSWFLRNKLKNQLGSPAVAFGPRQKQSNQTGVIAYFEIEELLSRTYTTVIYNNQSVSAYFNAGDLWVSFDSPDVVDEKITFASHNRLLGYFLWPISFDSLNFEISRQASDTWLKEHDNSVDADGVDAPKQALSPTELQPQNLAPTQYLKIYIEIHLHSYQ
ncbi:hypothetical protein QJS10_CPB11g00582 [Acorus calamus]|uniref:GH18 domain-containing protein n=1 Tax=Acorus calamus TaxID=4465 RepID=A0AAV9DSC1_ACOCL|nr:hypothetical protein QJS10_CPB11g00582 [Acorus calamus]